MNPPTYFLLLLFELMVATIFLHYLILRILPFLLYAVTKKVTIKNFNQLRYFNVPTPQNKTKMPSPELLYSIGFYDVRKSNVRIYGDIPKDTYWSIALHTNDSINFLTKNDHQYSAKRINILLVKADKADGVFADNHQNDVEILRVHSNKGIVVLRILEPNYVTAPNHYRDIQQSIVMEAV